MTNLESQGDILGFINPFADWKQLICFLTAADLHGSDSLPQDKETIDFVFSSFSFRSYIMVPKLSPLPPPTNMTNLESVRHIGFYKTVILNSRFVFWLKQTHVTDMGACITTKKMCSSTQICKFLYFPIWCLDLYWPLSFFGFFFFIS